MGKNELITQFTEKISQIIKLSSYDYKKTEEIRLILEDIKKYEVKKIFFDLLYNLEVLTEVEAFSVLKEVFLNQEFKPPKKLIEHLTEIIISGCELKEGFIDKATPYLNIFEKLFYYLGELWGSILNGFFSKNLKEKILKIIEFFELYSVLLKVVPIRMENFIEADFDKGWVHDFSPDEEDEEYYEYWREYYEGEFKNAINQIQVRIQNNYLRILLDSIWEYEIKAFIEDFPEEPFNDAFEELYAPINLIKRFNTQKLEFVLNENKVHESNGLKDPFFPIFLREFYDEQEYQSILDRLEGMAKKVKRKKGKKN